LLSPWRLLASRTEITSSSSMVNSKLWL
jgi:hypothetical protein